MCDCPLEMYALCVRTVMCVLMEAVGSCEMCLRRKQGEKSSLNVHSAAENNSGVCAGALQINTR